MNKIIVLVEDKSELAFFNDVRSDEWKKSGMLLDARIARLLTLGGLWGRDVCQ